MHLILPRLSGVQNSYNALAAVHKNDEGRSSNDIVEGVAEFSGLSNHAATHNAIPSHCGLGCFSILSYVSRSLALTGIP